MQHAKRDTVERIRGRRGVAIRSMFLREHPLCVYCSAKNRVREATQVDHVIALANGGPDTDENKQALCHECHREKSARDMGYRPRRLIGPDGFPVEEVRPDISREFSQRRIPMDLKPSRIPLTIVCGPPGSGKSTYVMDRATARDVVIDMDRIMSSQSGLPEHAVPVEWLKPAMEERNHMLRALASDTAHDHAWFIVSAPDPMDRKTWQRLLGGNMEVLAVPSEECIRRIKADPTRTGQTDRLIAAVFQWWEMNVDLRERDDTESMYVA